MGFPQAKAPTRITCVSRAEAPGDFHATQQWLQGGRDNDTRGEDLTTALSHWVCTLCSNTLEKCGNATKPLVQKGLVAMGGLEPPTSAL